MDRFFQVDNEFHDLVSQMGKNPLADKISRVVRTLTHAVRYETVATMINTGRGEELVAAHDQLYQRCSSRKLEDVEDIVRATYFGDTIHWAGSPRLCRWRRPNRAEIQQTHPLMRYGIRG